MTVFSEGTSYVLAILESIWRSEFDGSADKLKETFVFGDENGGE